MFIEGTHIVAVRRRCVVLVALSDLVKVVLVQLSNETCEIGVLEVLWKDMLGKPFVLLKR